MTNEPSAFAALTPSLLARKGHARPAMRPQASLMQTNSLSRTASLDDLGWNDMGDDQPQNGFSISKTSTLLGMTPMPVAEVPPVVQQQAELSSHFTSDEEEGENDLAAETTHIQPELIRRSVIQTRKAEEPAFQPVASASTGRKSAFTLRLDPDRHLHLRLVCAISHRSAQQVVIQALDAFLAEQPSLIALSGRTSASAHQFNKG